MCDQDEEAVMTFSCFLATLSSQRAANCFGKLVSFLKMQMSGLRHQAFWVAVE